MNPHLLQPDQQHYPLEEGDIEPTNRVSAYRHWLSTPLDYPHCPRCHRALMADGSCPSGDYQAARPEAAPGAGFLHFCNRLLAALRGL
jgi:hypothetical protein